MKQSALENNLRQLADFCREQGVMHTAWQDVNVASSCVEPSPKAVPGD
jgi:hypothetical protein